MCGGIRRGHGKGDWNLNDSVVVHDWKYPSYLCSHFYCIVGKTKARTQTSHEHFERRECISASKHVFNLSFTCFCVCSSVANNQLLSCTVGTLQWNAGKSVLETLQARPTSLLRCYENCSGAGASSCLPIGAFHAIVFYWGNNLFAIFVLLWSIVVAALIIHANIIYNFLYEFAFRYLSSLICLLRRTHHFVMIKAILIGQESLGKLYQ